MKSPSFNSQTNLLVTKKGPMDAEVSIHRPRLSGSLPPARLAQITGRGSGIQSTEFRTVDLIGVMKNRSPRSSRTSMQLPGFAKFGRSVPTRWAMNVACFLASRLDAQSCPNTSRAGISPTKSKKNLCMINVTNPRSMRSYQQRVLRDPRMIGIGELIRAFTSWDSFMSGGTARRLVVSEGAVPMASTKKSGCQR